MKDLRKSSNAIRKFHYREFLSQQYNFHNIPGISIVQHNVTAQYLLRLRYVLS